MSDTKTSISRVGVIGNSLIDADVEMGRLPHGIKDRRAWRLREENLRATEKNIFEWLESHGINAKIVFDSSHGYVTGIGIEVLDGTTSPPPVSR